MQALTLWQTLVKNGSASKACLSWSQTPAASSQYIAGKAAMMVNGPWNFPTMNEAKLFYGKQFGVVPVPTNKAGQKSIVPLGGEDWMVSKSGGTQAQQLAFEYIQGLQTPSAELKLAKLFGYLPGQDRRGEPVPEAGGTRVEGVRPPDPVRASAYAGPGCEVPEDLPGSVDGNSVRPVRDRRPFNQRWAPLRARSTAS